MNHDPSADHDDALIARALDQPDAAAPLDEAGLAEYREVLSHLPFDEVAPPPQLEDRIMAAARAARPAASPLSVERVARPSRRWRTWALPAVAAAAAAAAIVMVATEPDGGGGGRGGRDAALVARPRPADLAELLADPASRNLALVSAGGRQVGKAVLGTNGRGEVYDLTLPAAGTGETYWLWLTSDHGPVRVGELGGSPETAAFEVDGEVDGAVLSVETAGSTPAEPGPTAAEGRFASR